MSRNSIRVTYRLETSGNLEALAAKIASDQSTGAFTELPGETAAVRERCAATVEKITRLPSSDTPSIPDVGIGPYHRADVEIAYPLEAVGTDIATLMTITIGWALSGYPQQTPASGVKAIRQAWDAAR